MSYQTLLRRCSQACEGSSVPEEAARAPERNTSTIGNLRSNCHFFRLLQCTTTGWLACTATWRCTHKQQQTAQDITAIATCAGRITGDLYTLRYGVE
eukprot:9662-Heterococcus_DN1.PRE.2